MAERNIYFGTFGAYQFDDGDTYDDGELVVGVRIDAGSGNQVFHMGENEILSVLAGFGIDTFRIRTEKDDGTDVGSIRFSDVGVAIQGDYVSGGAHVVYPSIFPSVDLVAPTDTINDPASGRIRVFISGNDVRYRLSTGTEGSLISGTGATDLNGLSDVTLTSPAINSLLQYNGSLWIDVSLATAGIQAQDDYLDDIAALIGPGGDTLMFWDESEGKIDWLTIGSGLTVTTTTLSTTGLQAQDDLLDDIAALSDPGADRIMFWDDTAGNLAWLSLGSFLTFSGTSIILDNDVATYVSDAAIGGGITADKKMRLNINGFDYDFECELII